MKAALAVFLLAVSFTVSANYQTAQTESKMVPVGYHTVDQIDCDNIGDISYAAAEAKQNGVEVKAVWAGLLKPEHLEDNAFMAMLPTITGAVQSIYDAPMKIAPDKAKEQQKESCSKLIGKAFAYY